MERLELAGPVPLLASIFEPDALLLRTRWLNISSSLFDEGYCLR